MMGSYLPISEMEFPKSGNTMIAFSLSSVGPTIYQQRSMFYSIHLKGERGIILPLTCLGYQQHYIRNLSAYYIRSFAAFLLTIRSDGSSTPSRLKKSSFLWERTLRLMYFTICFMRKGYFWLMFGVKKLDSNTTPSYNEFWRIQSKKPKNTFIFYQSEQASTSTSPWNPLTCTLGSTFKFPCFYFNLLTSQKSSLLLCNLSCPLVYTS